MIEDESTAGSWRDTEARRRGLLREVNERIAALSRTFVEDEPGSEAEFICECGDPSCTERVEVPLDLYERVRAEPRRYLILVDHEDPETETVTAAGVRYAIVETLAGAASKIAETTDPRRSARVARARAAARGARNG